MQIHETIFLAKKIKKRTKMSDLLNFTYLYKVSSKVQEIIRSGFKTPRIGSYSNKTLIFLISRQKIRISVFFSDIFHLGEIREISNENQLVCYKSTLTKGMKSANISYLFISNGGLFHDISMLFSYI